jgi:hypothetical protein
VLISAKSGICFRKICKARNEGEDVRPEDVKFYRTQKSPKQLSLGLLVIETVVRDTF